MKPTAPVRGNHSVLANAQRLLVLMPRRGLHDATAAKGVLRITLTQ